MFTLFLALVAQGALAQRAPTVAACPAVNEIGKAAIPAWKKLHPSVDIQVVSHEFADHHTAMTTALSSGFCSGDVMSLEVDHVGRFATGGGLENLGQAPSAIGRVAARYVPSALAQATNRKGAIVVAPADIGPGTPPMRADVLERAGVTEAELTASCGRYVASGANVKSTAGACLLAHARDMKDLLIRTGIQPEEGLYFGWPIGDLGGQTARRLWREATRQIAAPGVHKQDSFAAEVIDTELDKVLDQGKEIQVAGRCSSAAAEEGPALKLEALR